MKKNLLFFLLFIIALGSTAQRFYYLQPNPVTDKLFKEQLETRSQFIAASPLASDFILESEILLGKEHGTLTLELRLKDTLTDQTIFQAKEEYQLKANNDYSRVFLRLAIGYFVDKNMPDLLMETRRIYNKERGNYLSARKDKT